MLVNATLVDKSVSRTPNRRLLLHANFVTRATEVKRDLGAEGDWICLGTPSKTIATVVMDSCFSTLDSHGFHDLRILDPEGLALRLIFSMLRLPK